MTIVTDYAAIAAELRRLRATRSADEGRAEPPEPVETAQTLDPRHRMRATPAGDLLYRRLVSRRRGWHSAI